MKKINYFLALSLITATSPAVYANAENHADSNQQVPQQNPSAAWEEVAMNAPSSNAEYVIAGEDFIFIPGKDNTNKIQLKKSNVVSKPHQGKDQKSIATKDFTKLWRSGGQYNQEKPTAALVWQKGSDQYEMDVTIDRIAPGKGKNLTLTAIPAGTEASFRKNGQQITQEEFVAAAAQDGKQDVAIWINETIPDKNPSEANPSAHPETATEQSPSGKDSQEKTTPKQGS